MKYVCIVALISMAVFLTHAQEIEKQEDVEEFEEVEVSMILGGHKPGHGKCRRYPFKFCKFPGTKTREDRDKCETCTCNGLFGETCCEGAARPIVKKPRHCDITRERGSCEYDLHSRCKGACEIIGYESSSLAEYDEGWPEEVVE